MPADNRVRERRIARGLSQGVLAELTRLTRQSLSAIEAGRSVPSVQVALRLAKALDAKVEELFTQEESVEAVAKDPLARGRVALANIAGRWVSLPLSEDGMWLSADGVVAAADRKMHSVVTTRPLAAASENLIITGCAAALGILSDRLNAQRGPGRFLWFSSGSTAALDALAAGMTHIAGVHLTDEETGEPNVTFVREAVSGKGEPVVLLTLARWEAGLLTRRDETKRASGVISLGGRRTRLVLREHGSGARRLLERELRSAGIAQDVVSRGALTAKGHMEVARLISLGAADIGMATRDAALAYGLHFVPLAEERYDLAVPRSLLADPRIERFFDMLVSAGVRRELASLGYDVTHTGERVTEVTTA